MIRDGFSPSTLLSTAHLTVTVNSLWGRGLWEIGWFRRAKLNPLASVHQWPRLTCGRATQPRFPNSSRSSRQPTRRRATVEANTARLMRGARAWEEGCRQFRALKLHVLPRQTRTGGLTSGRRRKKQRPSWPRTRGVGTSRQHGLLAPARE